MCCTSAFSCRWNCSVAVSASGAFVVFECRGGCLIYAVKTSFSFALCFYKYVSILKTTHELTLKVFECLSVTQILIR